MLGPLLLYHLEWDFFSTPSLGLGLCEQLYFQAPYQGEWMWKCFSGNFLAG